MNAAMNLLRAAAEAAWEEGYEAGYADRNVGAPATRLNPYAAKEDTPPHN